MTDRNAPKPELTPSSTVRTARLTRATVRTRRDGPSKLAAAPAVLAVAASLAVVLVLRGGGDISARYQRDAEAAMIAGDSATAQVCYERLLQSEPDNKGYREGLALALSRESPPTSRKP